MLMFTSIERRLAIIDFAEDDISSGQVYVPFLILLRRMVSFLWTNGGLPHNIS